MPLIIRPAEPVTATAHSAATLHWTLTRAVFSGARLRPAGFEALRVVARAAITHLDPATMTVTAPGETWWWLVYETDMLDPVWVTPDVQDARNAIAAAVEANAPRTDRGLEAVIDAEAILLIAESLGG